MSGFGYNCPIFKYVILNSYTASINSFNCLPAQHLCKFQTFIMKDKDNKEISNNSKSGIGEPIAQNPNPRANENIRDPSEDAKPDPEATDKPGSEITDGEAG